MELSFIIYFIYISFTVISIILSVFLYEKLTNKSIFKINMLNIPFWVLLIFASIQSLLILIDVSILGSIDDNLPIYESLENRLLVWSYIHWAMIGMPIGGLILKNLINEPIEYNLNQKNSHFLGGGNECIGYAKNIILALTFIFILVLILSINQNTPIMAMVLGSSSEELLALRGQQSEGNLLLKILKSILSYDVIQIFSLTAYFFMIQGKKDWTFTFYITFFACIFYGVVTGSTGSLVFYIAPLIYLRYLILNKFYSIYKIAIGIVLFIIFYISYKLQGDYDDFSMILKHIFNRIFFDQLKGLYYSFVVFPDFHDHLYFSSTAKWAHDFLSLYYSLDYGHILMSIYSPAGYDAGYASHFTSIFLTEIWSNFGFLGIIAGPVWAGIFVYFVFYIFSKYQKSLFSNILYANMSIVGFGYFSSFQSFYYPVRILIIYLSTYILLKIGIALQKK